MPLIVRVIGAQVTADSTEAAASLVSTHLERLAGDRADAWRIVAVKVEDNDDPVDAWSVGSTQTIVYLRQGTEVHRSTGAVTPSSVQEALQTYA